MRELEIALEEVAKTFRIDQQRPFVIVTMSHEGARAFAAANGLPGRRCYISDDDLESRVTLTGRSAREIVLAKLPDPGSVMSGEFGEILTAVYLAACALPTQVIEPKKWRLKQDRTKPAPYSDVVQFELSAWPDSSERDRLVCAEVKTKATNRDSQPIPAAIADSAKDQEGRLLKTLLWLRERALGQDLGTLRLEHLERFIHATEHPPAVKEFLAVAVICESLVDDEVADFDIEELQGRRLIIISVPELRDRYQELYESIASAVAVSESSP